MALYFVKLLEVFIALRQLFWRIDVLKKGSFVSQTLGIYLRSNSHLFVLNLTKSLTNEWLPVFTLDR